jgi:hypothetical protein
MSYFIQARPSISSIPAAGRYSEFRSGLPVFSTLQGAEQYCYFRVFQVDAEFTLRALQAQEHIPSSEFIPILLWFQDQIRVLIPQFPAFTHLFSHKVFSDILYKVLKNRIHKHIQRTRAYGIAVDTYTTKNGRSVLGITLKYSTAGERRMMREMFLGCVELDARGEAPDISVGHIRNLLEQFGLRFEWMITATFEGTAVNMGAFNGIGALLKLMLPHIQIIHCFAHAFVLCICVDVCILLSFFHFSFLFFPFFFFFPCLVLFHSRLQLCPKHAVPDWIELLKRSEKIGSRRGRKWWGRPGGVLVPQSEKPVETAEKGIEKEKEWEREREPQGAAHKDNNNNNNNKNNNNSNSDSSNSNSNPSLYSLFRPALSSPSSEAAATTNKIKQ